MPLSNRQMRKHRRNVNMLISLMPPADQEALRRAKAEFVQSVYMQHVMVMVRKNAKLFESMRNVPVSAIK